MMAQDTLTPIERLRLLRDKSRADAKTTKIATTGADDGGLSKFADDIDLAVGALQFLTEIVNALDSGNLEMNSPEIGGEPPQGFDDPGVPAHPWHEEWIYHVRGVIGKPAP